MERAKGFDVIHNTGTLLDHARDDSVDTLQPARSALPLGATGTASLTAHDNIRQSRMLKDMESLKQFSIARERHFSSHQLC
jgi:hypothetical protein